MGHRLKTLAVELSCPIVASAGIGPGSGLQDQDLPEGPLEDGEMQKVLRTRRPHLQQLEEEEIGQAADLVLKSFPMSPRSRSGFSRTGMDLWGPGFSWIFKQSSVGSPTPILISTLSPRRHWKSFSPQRHRDTENSFFFSPQRHKGTKQTVPGRGALSQTLSLLRSDAGDVASNCSGR